MTKYERPINQKLLDPKDIERYKNVLNKLEVAAPTTTFNGKVEKLKNLITRIEKLKKAISIRDLISIKDQMLNVVKHLSPSTNVEEIDLGNAFYLFSETIKRANVQKDTSCPENIYISLSNIELKLEKTFE